MVNFSDPEGYIDSSDDPPLSDGASLHCTYTVTVYTGYGVELQVCVSACQQSMLNKSASWWHLEILHCHDQLHILLMMNLKYNYLSIYQVKSVNLSEGELLSIRAADEQGALMVLANHTLLVEGQVIRSPTNTLSVYYRSTAEGNMGVFQLHYQSESMSSNGNVHVFIHHVTRSVHVNSCFCGDAGGLCSHYLHNQKCSQANT